MISTFLLDGHFLNGILALRAKPQVQPAKRLALLARDKRPALIRRFFLYFHDATFA